MANNIIRRLSLLEAAQQSIVNRAGSRRFAEALLVVYGNPEALEVWRAAGRPALAPGAMEAALADVYADI